MRIIWARRSVFASTATAGIVLALALTGCSGLTEGSLPGAGPGAGPGAASASSAPKAADCAANGTSIPSGHYIGTITARIKTTMSINTGGISIKNAGGGDEAWKGTIDLVSSGTSVTGTITMSELGLSRVGLAKIGKSSGVQVHSVDTSDLKGIISGPASKPVVAATGTGEWATLDAPVVNSNGSATSNLNGGLHITKADCTSISGNAVAMFADFTAPVAQYLSVSGSGTWVATRK